MGTVWEEITAWYIIKLICRWCAMIFAFNIIVGTIVFFLNVTFNLEIGSLLTNVQDFLLFLFMFGMAFLFTGAIGWSDLLWRKMKEYPVIAGIIILGMIAAGIPLGKFVYAEGQDAMLNSAISEGNTERVGEILKTYRPEKKRADYLFFMAISEGKLQLVPVLIAHGYDINAGDPNTGYTPLMSVAGVNNTAADLEFMLKNGASPFVQDREGQNVILKTVLDEYIPEQDSVFYAEWKEKIKILLAAAKGREKELLHQADNQGRTAISVAREKNLQDIVKLFEVY